MVELALYHLFDEVMAIYKKTIYYLNTIHK